MIKKGREIDIKILKDVRKSPVYIMIVANDRRNGKR